MRWFKLRKAYIEPELRNTFERYGAGSMQMILATTNYFRHMGSNVTAEAVIGDLLPWLTEQNDRAERRETWSLTMEAAITVLVATELVLRVF